LRGKYFFEKIIWNCLPNHKNTKAHYEQCNKKLLPFMKKISKGAFRQRVNIIHASSQFLFINFGLFIKASWVTIVLTNKNTVRYNKAFNCFTNQKIKKMDFKKGYCEKGWAALSMLTFGFYNCVAEKFISSELTRNKNEKNSSCKN
jgi:hypothetical protein